MIYKKLHFLYFPSTKLAWYEWKAHSIQIKQTQVPKIPYIYISVEGPNELNGVHSIELNSQYQELEMETSYDNRDHLGFITHGCHKEKN
jgi:hypothetical protein